MTSAKENNFASKKHDIHSYVSKGLVALFDCQNNVGYDKYDPNFNGVTNLVSGAQLKAYDRFQIGYPYAHGGRCDSFSEKTIVNAFLSDFTYELVWGFEDEVVNGSPAYVTSDAGTIFSLQNTIYGFPGIAEVRYEAQPNTNYLFQVRCSADSNDIFWNGKHAIHVDKLPSRTELNFTRIFGHETAGFESRRLISARVYSRCLSDEEILSNFKVDKARFGV